MKKLLIATTNQGKFQEIASELADLHFKIVSLKDLPRTYQIPEEDGITTEANAILKAKYYANKTNLLTMADDTGLFIKSLGGWPGVSSARIAKNGERKNTVLKKMKNVKDRSAIFRTDIALFDPTQQTLYTASGEVKGKILKKLPTKKQIINYDYNPIFYVPAVKKSFAQMTVVEKNLLSHRGQATIKLKLYLMKQYSFKQYLVPVGIIIKNKKMLMTKRRDIRKEYNDRWEFPGGGVEKEETIKQNLSREIKEETGYNINIIEQLPEIMSEVRNKFNYQVFLLAYICKIKSGKFKTADNEVSDYGWFNLKQALKKSLLPLNKKLLTDGNNQIILKKYLK